jgi:hypothetical protein
MMSYQVKTEDLTKVISLTLTAEQLETIAGALEMYCIGLAEHNDPHLKYAADAQEAIIEVLESNFGEVNDDFTIINDEVLILNAIQKLGVDFNENEDLRIFDKDNLVLIMNFSKFNKHGIERSQADTGLIMYKAHTESAYATICEDALML